MHSYHGINICLLTIYYSCYVYTYITKKRFLHFVAYNFFIWHHSHSVMNMHQSIELYQQHLLSRLAYFYLLLHHMYLSCVHHSIQGIQLKFAINQTSTHRMHHALKGFKKSATVQLWENYIYVMPYNFIVGFTAFSFYVHYSY